MVVLKFNLGDYYESHSSQKLTNKTSKNFTQ